MKKLIVIATAVAVMAGFGVGSASAATSLNKGSMGINLGFDTEREVINEILISGRYFIADEWALLAGAGIQGSSGDLDADYFSLLAGMRKYFTTREFAPFVDATLRYKDQKIDQLNVDTDQFDLTAGLGAEYFLSQKFSFEGSVGLVLGAAEDNTTGLDNTFFGTRSFGVSANLYF